MIGNTGNVVSAAATATVDRLNSNATLIQSLGTVQIEAIGQHVGVGRKGWFDAPDLAGQKTIAAQIQIRAFETVPYTPLGQLFQPTAFRSDINDIVAAGVNGHIDSNAERIPPLLNHFRHVLADFVDRQRQNFLRRQQRFVRPDGDAGT